MRIIRHYFRSAGNGCMCGMGHDHPWHQGVTEEDDAEYERACKAYGIDFVVPDRKGGHNAGALAAMAVKPIAERLPHVTHKQVMDVIDRVMGERHGSQWFNAANNQDAVAQAIVELVETGRDLGDIHTHDAAMHERTWDAVFAACVGVIGDDTGSHATAIEIADRACKALETKPAKYGNG